MIILVDYGKLLLVRNFMFLKLRVLSDQLLSLSVIRKLFSLLMLLWVTSQLFTLLRLLKIQKNVNIIINIFILLKWILNFIFYNSLILYNNDKYEYYFIYNFYYHNIYYQKKKKEQPPYKTITTNGSKFTIARWGYLNKTIVAGHDDGTITIFDSEVI